VKASCDILKILWHSFPLEVMNSELETARTCRCQARYSQIYHYWYVGRASCLPGLTSLDEILELRTKEDVVKTAIRSVGARIGEESLSRVDLTVRVGESMGEEKISKFCSSDVAAERVG
jgi:hypothetical protein